MRALRNIILGGVLAAAAFALPAGAHVVPSSDASVSCTAAEWSWHSFPSGSHPFSLAVTQPGSPSVSQSVPASGSAGTVSVPLSLVGNGLITATVSWTADGGGSTTVTATDDCRPPEPPTTTKPPVEPPVTLVPPVTVTRTPEPPAEVPVNVQPRTAG